MKEDSRQIEACRRFLAACGKFGLLPRNGTTLKVRVSAILSFEGARNGTEGLHA